MPGSIYGMFRVCVCAPRGLKNHTVSYSTVVLYSSRCSHRTRTVPVKFTVYHSGRLWAGWSRAMTDAPTPVTTRELVAMNEWATLTARQIETEGASDGNALRERIDVLSNFSSSVLPKMIRQLPVLYLFSGMDLITAHALFPAAPAYHLSADLPAGHPSCFVDVRCLSQANASALAFFQHWSNLRYTRQSTNLMRRAFERVGVLPALILSLHLVGQPLLHATTHSVPPPAISTVKLSADHLIKGGTPKPRVRDDGRRLADQGKGVRRSRSAIRIPRITLHTERARIMYYSMLLRSDPSEHVKLSRQDWPVMKRWAAGGPFIDTQLDSLSEAIASTHSAKMHVVGSPPQVPLMVSVFKAAPHWILRNSWMAQWVLARSAATVHDETGLRPRYYNASAGIVTQDWNVVRRGIFVDFENREMKWYPGEKAELQALFRGPKLPFQFGYAQQGTMGVLQAAWRGQTE